MLARAASVASSSAEESSIRGLSQRQLIDITAMGSQSAALRPLLPLILEKEIIVKDVVLEVAKVGQDSGFQLIFSGGTSLSQGWGLIERISEDVDFRVISPSFPSKNSKSKALSGLKAALYEKPGSRLTAK